MAYSVHFEDYRQVVVVGGGFAGMYAAISAYEAGAEVTILCKSKTGGSGNSIVAMSVHRYAPDEPSLRNEYRSRFLASGAGQQRAEAAEYFVDKAAGYMDKIREYGFPLEFRTIEKNGVEYPNFACCSPKKGMILTKAVREYLNEKTSVKIEDNVMVCDILCSNGQVAGVMALRGDQLICYPAGAVILAAGGAGNVYSATSNTSDVTGDGYAMASRCGVQMTGMEFVQFYPYRIYSPSKADIFPDIFAHGAVYRNEKGERFMDKACYPRKEQENRDIVARAMYEQKEVRLDLTNCDMDYLSRECPNIFKMYHDYPDRDLLVRPVAHFLMGGIPIEKNCSTSVSGLYACGEVCGGLHGANRLAGSALTECVMFGRISGEQAAGYAKAKTEYTLPFAGVEKMIAEYPLTGEDDLKELRHKLREVMWKNVSLVRSGTSLRRAQREIRSIKKSLNQLHPRKLKEWMELRNMIFTSESITKAALKRTESLGAHYRTDSNME